MPVTPILSSGRQEIYRPTYRAEILRRIVKKYIKKEGKFITRLTGADIDTQLGHHRSTGRTGLSLYLVPEMRPVVSPGL